MKCQLKRGDSEEVKSNDEKRVSERGARIRVESREQQSTSNGKRKRQDSVGKDSKQSKTDEADNDEFTSYLDDIDLGEEAVEDISKEVIENGTAKETSEKKKSGNKVIPRKH
jgi:hypothetical protein